MLRGFDPINQTALRPRTPAFKRMQKSSDAYTNEKLLERCRNLKAITISGVQSKNTKLIREVLLKQGLDSEYLKFIQFINGNSIMLVTSPGNILKIKELVNKSNGTLKLGSLSDFESRVKCIRTAIHRTIPLEIAVCLQRNLSPEEQLKLFEDDSSEEPTVSDMDMVGSL